MPAATAAFGHGDGLARPGPPGQGRRAVVSVHGPETPLPLRRGRSVELCEQNISAMPPGAAQRARGIAQAVTSAVNRRPAAPGAGATCAARSELKR